MAIGQLLCHSGDVLFRGGTAGASAVRAYPEEASSSRASFLSLSVYLSSPVSRRLRRALLPCTMVLWKLVFFRASSSPTSSRSSFEVVFLTGSVSTMANAMFLTL